MDNFNIHKYLKKEYLSESVDDESAEYYFDYLNKLRDSGVTNMFGAGSYLQAVFGLDKGTAREILAKWMKSMNEDRKAKEYIKSIEDEDEREEERKRMFDNPEDLDEVELTQDFGELDEAELDKKEKKSLKKISSQLKKSVKSHDKQSKIIDKIVKEILSEATFKDEIERLEKIMYVERLVGGRFVLHPLDKADVRRPSNNYIVIDGNNVTSVQGFNTGPISVLADRYGLDDEDSRMTPMGKTNAEGRVSLLSSNILKDAIKAIEDSRDLEAKAQSDYYSSKPDTGRIGYGLSRQPRMNEMDMNDPVLMRMRASKPEPSRGGLDFEDVMYLRDEQKDLEDRIAQLYRDMEQEAEPEGGEIADRYGNMLNKLEDKLYRVKKQINQYDINESTRQDLGIGSSVSKRRAKAELKNPGNDGSKVYGLDKDGKRVHIKSINDVDKFKKFELDADLNERVIYDNETQLLKARIAADDFMRIYRSEFRRVFSNFGKEAEAEFIRIVKDKFSKLQEEKINEGHSLDSKDMQVLKDAFNHLFASGSGFTKLEDLRRVIKYIMDTNAKELNEKLEQVNEKLCKKGEAYRKRRMAAGEKSSAYLSGRAVKVCKGQMSGKKKKK